MLVNSLVPFVKIVFGVYSQSTLRNDELKPWTKQGLDYW